MRYSFANAVKFNANGNVMAGGRLAYRFNESKLTASVQTGYHAIFNVHEFATPSLGLGYDFHLNDEDKKDKEIPWLFVRISGGYRF
ncbi:MAG: hypothetical protein C4308_12585 [Chitinophagaceae bacterium]